jgi:alpha-L-fucosidase
MCETLNDNWGDADDINFKPVKQIIEEICDCRKIGANMLLNIGPCGDGTVPPMSRATMGCVGYWMNIYGKAIYNGRPYIAVEGKRDFILRDIKDPKTFYLFKYDLGMGGDTNVALDGGAAGIVEFDGFEETAESVRWLDDGADLNFEQNGTNIKIGCNNFRYGQSHCVRVAEIKVK